MTLRQNELAAALDRARASEHALYDEKESAAPIRDNSGNTIGAVLVFEDVSQTRELTRRLSYQASHDALTGLYNRGEFELRLKIALKKARVEKQQITLCYMDLDQFKLVRDRVHVYEADDAELQRRRSDMLWVNRIRQALKEDRFRLYQQPIIPIGANRSDATHHEILLRMLDEDGKLLAPDTFLGAADCIATHNYNRIHTFTQRIK